jgi:twitching motility protein PilT
MLKTSTKISDLFFSPGKPPLVEINGKLASAGSTRPLTTEDTRRIAGDLIGKNKHAIENLKELGSCDVSYSLPGTHRFRVNVFMQRGTCAIVMRVIPSKVMGFEQLGLPEELKKIVHLRNGIVLVTGPTGSGKSSTLAAVIDKINQEQCFHVLTIEDPVEFLHPHKNCIVHQRELHSDTPNFALALRAALRQAPKVILVGEMRDRETIEIAMEAAETGHLVLSTLHTIDAAKTVERIVGVFPLAEQHTLRNRLAKSFRYIVSQRLIPRKDGSGRIAAIEILKSTLRTRDYVEKGEGEVRPCWTQCATATRTACSTSMARSSGWFAKASSTWRLGSRTPRIPATCNWSWPISRGKRPSRYWTARTKCNRLERLLRIQQNRYRSLVHEFHSHHLLKAAGFAAKPSGADFVDETFVKLTRLVGRCGVVE